MHALDSDMMQWVINTADQAPAFVLSREGYDVWLGNNRGARWSQSHLNYTTDQKEFWDFTWEEMGTHDTPTFINFILNQTGHK
jgi:hypothetical protein